MAPITFPLPSDQDPKDSKDPKDPREEDPFDTLLNIEETLYTEGYKAGFADGTRQTALESRVFGIEQGYQKALAMGRVRARAQMLTARSGVSGRREHEHEHEHGSITSTSTSPSNGKATGASKSKSATTNKSSTTIPLKHPLPLPLPLPPIPSNTRLDKHIQTLSTLSNPSTTSFENDDDAVADFDDRLKRANAKVKIIEKIIGEESGGVAESNGGKAVGRGGRENMEDFGMGMGSGR